MSAPPSRTAGRSATSCSVPGSPGPEVRSNGCAARSPARCCDISSTGSSASGIAQTCSGCCRWRRSIPIGDLGAPRRVGQWTTLCRSLGLVDEADWSRAVDTLAGSQRRLVGSVGATTPMAPPTWREVADADALERLLKLVERLRNQSRRVVQRDELGRPRPRRSRSMLEDHIGVSTWRERAWADGPAWQRNAADHVERCRRRAGRTRSRRGRRAVHRMRRCAR